MEKQVCIVNFNTPELTRAAIKSLWKNTPDAKVTVFDNSDKRPFGVMEGVSVIDNTRGQVIDFEEFLAAYPEKVENANDWGSAKHTYTIDKLFDYFPDGFVLMDSDVLVKKDISVFFDESVAWAGKIYIYKLKRHAPRLLPFLCWINVSMCIKHGIRYFDEDKNFKLNKNETRYDTGGSFLYFCRDKELPSKEIDIDEYILHFGNGSWMKQSVFQEWLDEHKELYMSKEEINKAKKDEKKEYLVVIPFFAGGAQGREIEYAVAGWRRHFKEPHKIVIVGDYHPVVDTGDDIVFIPCERVGPQPEKNYRPHIDFVKKFKKVRERFPESKGFIFVADDCYAVNDFDITDVKFLKQMPGSLRKYLDKGKAFNRDKIKTRELLFKEGYPIRNFTTHIPQWFEWDKLEALWDRYDMENESYVFEDLYYNIYFPTRVPIKLHIDHDNLKCGVYRPNPRMWYIEEAFKKKIWIQNSVEGWIPVLDRMLAEYYGLDK